MNELTVVMGRTLHGEDLTTDLVAGGHHLGAGETRSGKSVMTYGLLSQIVANGGASVRVVGIDPTTVLLRPLADRLAPAVDPWLVLGTEEPARMVAVMSEIRAEMNRRLGVIAGEGQDKLATFSPALPLLVVVLEELPGIMRVLAGADAESGAKPAERLSPKFKNHFETLAAEAAKTGIRLICLAQRPDADILGGYAREQLTTRWSFRTSGRESTAMMFPDLTADELDAAGDLEPGMGWCREPGRRPLLFRADFVPSYQHYARYIARHDLGWLRGLASVGATQ